MKSELKAKFLQHLSRKNGETGFTLIELLVVIIIIGILSAIALPAFLNQANKAKQSEARTNVGSMNRAQQAVYMEKGQFVNQIGTLGLGIATQTTNYDFSIVTAAPDAKGKVTMVTNQGRPRVNAIKAYVGGVKQGTIQATSEATTLVRLCEAIKAQGITGAVDGSQQVTDSGNAEEPPVCPALNTDYTELGS